ncbi:3633_t:CDS:1, partial [Paraglomus occultum]
MSSFPTAKKPDISVITTTTSPVPNKISIDFSDFLQDDFNVKAWINKALTGVGDTIIYPPKEHSRNVSIDANKQSARSKIKSIKDRKWIIDTSQLNALENHVSVLLDKLHFLNQEVSSRLERTVEDAVKNMPQTLAFLQVIKNDIIDLKARDAAVKKDLETVEGNTGEALEHLKYIDLIKNRMEASRAMLREAESWNNLEAEAGTIFASQDYQKASARLAEAEKSLIIFRNTPEYEERRKLLTELQNQLEATVSPQLVAALNQHDLAACQKFYLIFSQIGRKKDFCNYYYGARKSSLIQLWQNTPILEDTQTIAEESAGPESRRKFVEFLREFFDECFIVLNEEHTWCGNVFPDADEVLCALIEIIFSSLKPSLAARLAGLVERYNEKCLSEIINAFTVCENFGHQFESVLFKSVRVDAGTHSITATKRHSRNDLIKWGHVIFEPFSDYQHDYAEYEKTYLSQVFRENLHAEKGVSVDTTRAIADSVGKVFSLVEGSLSRCMALTHGFGGVGLIDAVNYFFEAVFMEYNNLLKRLRVECGLNANRQHDQQYSTLPSNRNENTYDFDQEKLETDDWSNFQLGLRLLGICRQMSERLANFESKVKETLNGTRALIEDNGLNADLEWYDRRSVTLDGFSGTRTSLMLLRQSPLNSYLLNQLLTCIESKQLFELSVNSLTSFTKQCQLFVFDTIYLPIVKHLAGLPTMSIWNSNSEDNRRSAFNLEIPSFSLQPSKYIMSIGEDLLNLPSQFEIYADDSALAFSISSLPYADSSTVDADDNSNEEESSDEDVVHNWMASIA